MKFKFNLRSTIMIFFFVLFTIFSLRHFILGGKVAASVDALCPFGGFETLLTFITSGGFIPRILMSSLVLAFGILISTLILKKGFCGYICPFGFLQELVNKIPVYENKITDKLSFLKKYDTKFRYSKYIILIAILVGTFITGKLVFRAFDPFMTFFHFGKGILWDYDPVEFVEHLLPAIILVTILGLSLYIDRFFCKYICPLGAVMNLTSKFGLTKIKLNKRKCIDCGICDRSCPMNIDVSKNPEVKSLECINCNECIKSCPKDALNLKIGKKIISTTTYAIALLVIFFSVIAAAKMSGIWESVPGTSLKDASGNLDAANIKGWMTLNDVSKETNIPLEHFYHGLNLPDDLDLDLPLKQIKSTYDTEFETEELREFVRTYDSSNFGTELTCPWGIKNDPIARCGYYQDENHDGLCDLSQ